MKVTSTLSIFFFFFFCGASAEGLGRGFRGTQEGEAFSSDIHPHPEENGLSWEKSRKGLPPSPLRMSGSPPNAKFLLWNLNPSSIFLTVAIVSTERMSDSMRFAEAEGDWEWWGPANI